MTSTKCRKSLLGTPNINGDNKLITDTGDIGDTGDTGDTGDIGDKGDTGAIGHIGDTGDIGDTRDTGDTILPAFSVLAPPSSFFQPQSPAPKSDEYQIIGHCDLYEFS